MTTLTFAPSTPSAPLAPLTSDTDLGREVWDAYVETLAYHEVTREEKALVSHFCMECGSIAFHHKDTPVEGRAFFHANYHIRCCGDDTTVLVS